MSSLTGLSSLVEQQNSAISSGSSNTIDPADYSSADALSAAVTRNDWDTFEQNDMPYIMQYAQDIVSGQSIADAVDDAQSTSNTGYALAKQAQERSNRGLGLSLSSAQQANQTQDMERSQVASRIAAMNEANVAATDRRTALLSGAETGL